MRCAASCWRVRSPALRVLRSGPAHARMSLPCVPCVLRTTAPSGEAMLSSANDSVESVTAAEPAAPLPTVPSTTLVEHRAPEDEKARPAKTWCLFKPVDDPVPAHVKQSIKSGDQIRTFQCLHCDKKFWSTPARARQSWRRTCFCFEVCVTPFACPLDG